MSQGRKISLVYGAGLSFGLVFWGLLAASGMGAILQSSYYVLSGLKIAGGLYLIWLAYLSARAAWQPPMQSDTVSGDKRWFLRGFLLNLSNPKTVIAWMAALSVGLEANSGSGAIIAATGVCSCVGFFNNALYSILFSYGGMMRGYQRFQRWINGVVGSLFALAGLGLIRSAFASRD